MVVKFSVLVINNVISWSIVSFYSNQAVLILFDRSVYDPIHWNGGITYTEAIVAMVSAATDRVMVEVSGGWWLAGSFYPMYYSAVRKAKIAYLCGSVTSSAASASWFSIRLTRNPVKEVLKRTPGRCIH